MKMWSFLVILMPLLSCCAGVQRVPGLPMDCFADERDINLAYMVKVSSKGESDLCTGQLYSAARVKYVEALVYSIRQINARNDLLPNISLGFVIMDTCGRDLACLARATYLIPDPDDTNTPLYANDTCRPIPQKYRVAGVIGPATSREAVLLSSLMSIFQIPVVATFSTSDELSDKSRFEYYLRLVPPDRFQAEAIIDLLVFFEWTYALLLFSEGSYGENAGKLTVRRARDKGVCFAFAEVVSSELTIEGMEDLVNKLAADGKARALVLFLEPFHLDMLITTIDKLELRGYFLIVGGDTMSDTDYGPPADGTMVIHFTGREVPDFNKYYLTLTPRNNPRNPWMKNLWELLYDCQWNSSVGDSPCSKYENTPFLNQDVGQKISTVMDGAYVFARGIDTMIRDMCPEAFRNKDVLTRCITGKTLLPYLRRTSFEGFSTAIKFDLQGDMIGSYSIRQYKHNAKPVFVEIAVWDQQTSSISVSLDVIDWTTYKDGSVNKSFPESMCSRPCAPKEHYVRKELPCCWDCKKCRQNERLVDNSTACEACALLMWPDTASQTRCEPIELNFLHWNDSVSVALTILSVLGILISLVTMTIYALHRNTRLIKASSRELSAIILLGILLAYCTIFFYVARPDDITCAVNRFGFGVTLSLIYVPLLVKTNRIYRIFSAGRKGKMKPSLIESKAQLAICLALLSIQVRICDASCAAIVRALSISISGLFA